MSSKAQLPWIESDFAHCHATWQGLQARDCSGCTDCNDPESSDCFTSETVMCSFGYAEVYADGDVISGGVWLFSVSEGE